VEVERLMLSAAGLVLILALLAWGLGMLVWQGLFGARAGK